MFEFKRYLQSSQVLGRFPCFNLFCAGTILIAFLVSLVRAQAQMSVAGSMRTDNIFWFYSVLSTVVGLSCFEQGLRPDILANPSTFILMHTVVLHLFTVFI